MMSARRGAGTPLIPLTSYEASLSASPDAMRPQGIRTSADLERMRGRLVTGACKLTRLTRRPAQPGALCRRLAFTFWISGSKKERTAGNANRSDAFRDLGDPTRS